MSSEGLQESLSNPNSLSGAECMQNKTKKPKLPRHFHALTAE